MTEHQTITQKISLSNALLKDKKLKSKIYRTRSSISLSLYILLFFNIPGKIPLLPHTTKKTNITQKIDIQN